MKTLLKVRFVCKIIYPKFVIIFFTENCSFSDEYDDFDDYMEYAEQAKKARRGRPRNSKNSTKQSKVKTNSKMVIKKKPAQNVNMPSTSKQNPVRIRVPETRQMSAVSFVDVGGETLEKTPRKNNPESSSSHFSSLSHTPSFGPNQNLLILTEKAVQHGKRDSFFDWTPENIVELINFVRQQALFYDKTHTDFKNTSKKLNKMKKFAEELGTTAVECNHKWNSIKTKYFNDINKVVSGQAAQEISLEDAALKTQLSFLDKCRDRRAVRVVGQETPALNEDLTVADVHPQTDIDSSYDVQILKTLNAMTGILDKSKEINPSCQSLGDLIASELSSVESPGKLKFIKKSLTTCLYCNFFLHSFPFTALSSKIDKNNNKIW